MLANQFVAAAGDLAQQTAVSTTAEQLWKDIDGGSKRKKRAERYVKLMRGALRESSEKHQAAYFLREVERLERLLKDSTLSDKKREELEANANISKSFLPPNSAVKSSPRSSDEL